MIEKKNLILTCCGFHRSATSVTAQWIHKAGITMGNWLMPGAKSNLDGHFEDMPMVTLNNQLLKLNGTNWYFHDEVALNRNLASKQYSRYIQNRDRIHNNTQWGVKDPRLCLFLPEWHKETEGRGRYLIIVRHWKECIQSLLKRDLDSDTPVFTENKKITAQMWYSYNSRLLNFASENPKECFILRQSEIDKGFNLPKTLNTQFGLSLNENTPSPYKHSLISRVTENHFDFNFLNEKQTDRLETLWERLINHDNQLDPYRPLGKITSPTLPELVATNNTPDYRHEGEDIERLLADLNSKMNDMCVINVEQWIDLSRKAVHALEYEIAEKALQVIVVFGKAPPFAYIMLADCKYALNKVSEAILLYRKGINLTPNNSNFFLKLGNLYLNEGEITKAKEVFSEGITNNPENSKWLRSSLASLS